ncbi:RES domain-containing protein [Curtobacterium sp. MCBD17_035]|nr:RES domain-containing protein [Curtobacterium sp. MCBD17_035]WIB66973.1 RES domain-containing protein [Curtobacterium sp. MCBD17_035]
MTSADGLISTAPSAGTIFSTRSSLTRQDHRQRLTASYAGRTEPAGSAPFAVEWNEILPPFMAAFWREYTRSADAPYYEHETVGLESTDWAVGYMTQNAFTHLEQIIPAITEAITDDAVGTVGALMTSDHLDHAWATFSHTVRHETRFVFTGAEGPAALVREFLDLVGSYATDVGGLITELPTMTEMYRARTVNGKVFPGRTDLPIDAASLGPAPARSAGANRMSPAGIAMFYGAADEATALNETAAFTVAEHAVVGVFHPARPLRMLNLRAAATEHDISPFDEDRLALRGLLMFFSEFQRHISSPITPDGRQHIDYVPTQILAEYFRRAVTPRLDGIIFASSHTGESNYVVFATDENVVDDDTVAAEAATDGLFDVPIEPETLLILDRRSLVLRQLHHTVSGTPVATLGYGRWIATPPAEQ